MRKFYFPFIFSLSTGLTNSTNSQDLIWAKQIGGINHEVGYSITVDVNGSVYTTGFFQDTCDFNSGIGTYNLVSLGGKDIFVSKLDASGNFQWAIQMGGSLDDIGSSIAVDINKNIYLTGNFNGTTDFDPGIGIYNLISSGLTDIFILKLDSLGNFLWVKQYAGSASDLSHSIILDIAGNVYTTGRFSGITDFDPGVGIFNLTSSGNHDIFISKLDVSGNFLWAKKLGGTGPDSGLSITLDANPLSGGIYTTGSFEGTADFDPGTGIYNLSSSGSLDMYISKLDTSGNFIWAGKIGGSTNNEFGYAIAVDANGNVYTTGQFEGTVDFDPGAGAFNLTSFNGDDIFISKLSSSGNFIWARQLGGMHADYGRSIDIGISGSIYVTGYFNDTADFDPGIGIYNLIATGSADIFVSKLDSSGTFLWAQQMGGSNYEESRSITVDAIENVYATGLFYDTTDFDPGIGIYSLTSAGYGDIFIFKLGTITGIMQSSYSLNSIHIFPNPNNGQIRIISSDLINEIKITNILGQMIYQSNPNENDFLLQLSKEGVYFAKITIDKETSTKKIIVHK